MKKTIRKKPQIIILFLGVLFAFILTACGKKDPLEGTWKRIDYQINQDRREINLTELEISFADGRMTKGNITLLYELADDGNSVYLSDGSTETKIGFDIKNNSLVFDADLYYKADSDEYRQYHEEIEKKAQAELDELLARIAEEEALKKAKKEALVTALQLWDNSVNKIVNDLNSAVSDTQDRLKNELIPMLEGTWIYNHPARIDRYVFANGTVILSEEPKMWGDERTTEGVVEVALTPYLDFAQFDDKQLSNDTLEIDFKLDVLKEKCPFNEEWELKDLQNAESYIAEYFEPLYSQIDNIKNLTLENLKNSKNILSVIFNSYGSVFGTVDVSTITSEKMIMINHSSKYELFKQ